MQNNTSSNSGRFIKTPLITDTKQLVGLRKGQWIQLAWCDKPSRLHSVDTRGHVTAFHFPGAARRFATYERDIKAVDAFAKFNRHARELSRSN